jgi:hypothetical protein
LEPVQLAAVLAAVVVLASMLSVELGVAVALLELGLGVAAGNVFDFHSQQWLDFIASFASIVLTFLAGLEVEPAYFRERFGASVGIGLVSFVGPFVTGSLVAFAFLGWSAKASLIAGTALPTTSLAVIYAVLVEDGLNETGMSTGAFGRPSQERSSVSPYGDAPGWSDDVECRKRLVSEKASAAATRLCSRRSSTGPRSNAAFESRSSASPRSATAGPRKRS